MHLLQSNLPGELFCMKTHTLFPTPANFRRKFRDASRRHLASIPLASRNMAAQDEPLAFSDDEFASETLLVTQPGTPITSSPSFADSLKEWIFVAAHRDALVQECSKLKPAACVSRLLRAMFSEDTLAENTYAGKRVNGVPTLGLTKQADTKRLLDRVHESALAFAPSMTRVEFGSYVNETCQRIRAKRKHAFETTFYHDDLNWTLRGALYERVSKLLHERFEEDVRDARQELKRRLDDFRIELSNAEDDDVELWNERYSERLHKHPPLKIRRSETKKIRDILA